MEGEKKEGRNKEKERPEKGGSQAPPAKPKKTKTERKPDEPACSLALSTCAFAFVPLVFVVARPPLPWGRFKIIQSFVRALLILMRSLAGRLRVDFVRSLALFRAKCNRGWSFDCVIEQIRPAVGVCVLFVYVLARPMYCIKI